MQEANRSTRRAIVKANRRRLINSLREMGCRCRPVITPDPTPIVDAQETGEVRHALTCPLNIALNLAYAPGQEPVHRFEGVRGCER